MINQENKGKQSSIIFNLRFDYIVHLMIILGILLISLSYGIPESFAVEEKTWYVGEGLKKGDYFSYSLCHDSYFECLEFRMDMWIKENNQTKNEPVWIVDVIVYDNDNVIKGEIQLGKNTLTITNDVDELKKYVKSFRHSVLWLSYFTTSDENPNIKTPKEFSAETWGKLSGISPNQIVPTNLETITVPAGTWDTIKLQLEHNHHHNDGIWVVDEFPFPIMGLIHIQMGWANNPVEYNFKLLDYHEDTSELSIESPDDSNYFESLEILYLLTFVIFSMIFSFVLAYKLFKNKTK